MSLFTFINTYSTGNGSLAASASSFCSLACLRLQWIKTEWVQGQMPLIFFTHWPVLVQICPRKVEKPFVNNVLILPLYLCKIIRQQTSRPAVFLVLSVQLVGLLRLLSHPAWNQLLVVLRCLPQLLLQRRESDLQGVVLVLQRLVCSFQVLQKTIQEDLKADLYWWGDCIGKYASRLNSCLTAKKIWDVCTFEWQM